MNTRSFVVGGAVTFLAFGLVAGCPGTDSDLSQQVADLESQVAALTDELQQAQQSPGIDGQNGADGIDGEDGLSCWDLNGNGVGDADEDINGDGKFDAEDCIGEDGADGADGAAGAAGADGEDLTGVLARAQVDADGNNVSGGAEISASRIGTGRYEILVALPEELDDAALDHFDFPVVVTPWAIEITPGVEAMFVVSTTALDYADTDSDGVRDQLKLNVTVMKIFPGDVTAWDDGFSIVVLEP